MTMGRTYTIDFNTMQQINEDSGTAGAVQKIANPLAAPASGMATWCIIYVALNVDNCGMYTFNGSSMECIHSTCKSLNVHIARLTPVECIHSMDKTWNVYNPWPITWNVDRNKP